MILEYLMAVTNEYSKVFEHHLWHYYYYYYYYY